MLFFESFVPLWLYSQSFPPQRHKVHKGFKALLICFSLCSSCTLWLYTHFITEIKLRALCGYIRTLLLKLKSGKRFVMPFHK
jgi:hypothetical protein